ncbi:unnamed protein product [Rhizoctonia solani]|nr:unnamed protein product [Rhizoctonia solani]
MALWMNQAQQTLQDYIPTKDEDLTAPFLQALIECAPTELGRRNICNSILRCLDNITPEKSLSDLLYKLREHYLTGLIYPMRVKGGKTPQATEQPSRQDSIEDEPILNELYLSEAKRDCHMLRALVLLRDNYRSVVTGVADLRSAKAGKVSSDLELARAEVAHILPFSLANNQSERTIAWTVLSSFSGMDLTMILGGNDINRLGNVFTLSVSEHELFGGLDFWLEEVVGQGHTYITNSVYRLADVPRGTRVTLVDRGLGLEMPDPRLIAIHAACAKVVHQSGMTGYIDRVLKDMEEAQVLAEDGSSNALTIALSYIAVN